MFRLFAKKFFLATTAVVIWERLGSVSKKTTQNPMAVGDVMQLDGLKSKPEWNWLTGGS